MEKNPLERRLSEQEVAQHHHPRHPEEQYVCPRTQ
jgi:hypothetical protein